MEYRYVSRADEQTSGLAEGWLLCNNPAEFRHSHANNNQLLECNVPCMVATQVSIQ
jgi:hypothetical protein